MLKTPKLKIPLPLQVFKTDAPTIHQPKFSAEKQDK